MLITLIVLLQSHYQLSRHAPIRKTLLGGATLEGATMKLHESESFLQLKKVDQNFKFKNGEASF